MIHRALAVKNAKRDWVLDADLKSAFDRIDHNFLLDRIGTFPAREQIRAWLKAGVVDRGRYSPTDEGTPQGGVISPLLLNIALQGMEQAAGVKYDYRGSVKAGCPTVITYADDFVVLCHTREQAETVHADRRMADGTGSFPEPGKDANRPRRRRVRLPVLHHPPLPRPQRHEGAHQTQPRRAQEDPATDRRRATRPPWRQPCRGDHEDEPDHPRPGELLPARGVQEGIPSPGQPPVAAPLQMGPPQAPQETPKVGHRPLLRALQPDQAQPVGLRRPRNRRLPPPATPGRRSSGTSRSPAGTHPTTLPWPSTGPTGDANANPRNWPSPGNAPCASNTDSARCAGNRCCTPTTCPTPHPVGDLVRGHPQGDGPPGHHRTAATGRHTASYTPTAPDATQTTDRTAPTSAYRCLPAHAGCLSRVPRRVARTVLRGRRRSNASALPDTNTGRRASRACSRPATAPTPAWRTASAAGRPPAWTTSRPPRWRSTRPGAWPPPSPRTCCAGYGCSAWTPRWPTPNPRPCATGLLHTAARIVRGQRKRKIKIPETWPWAHELAAAFHTAFALTAPT